MSEKFQIRTPLAAEFVGDEKLLSAGEIQTTEETIQRCYPGSNAVFAIEIEHEGEIIRDVIDSKVLLVTKTGAVVEVRNFLSVDDRPICLEVPYENLLSAQREN